MPILVGKDVRMYLCLVCDVHFTMTEHVIAQIFYLLFVLLLFLTVWGSLYNVTDVESVLLINCSSGNC